LITKERWQAERMLMQSVFPDFKDFGQVEENNVLGFMGTVTGIRTGVCYRVTLFCARSSYPAEPPASASTLCQKQLPASMKNLAFGTNKARARLAYLR